MFGLTPIAAAPFASLAGATYVVSVGETFTITDAVVGGADYLMTNAESFSLADAAIGTASIVTDVSELFTVTDIYDGIRAQYADVAESMTLSESIFPRGCFTINENQATSWAGIPTNTTIWSSINNNQVPGWTPIDDSQG